MVIDYIITNAKTRVSAISKTATCVCPITCLRGVHRASFLWCLINILKQELTFEVNTCSHFLPGVFKLSRVDEKFQKMAILAT